MDQRTKDIEAISADFSARIERASKLGLKVEIIESLGGASRHWSPAAADVKVGATDLSFLVENRRVVIDFGSEKAEAMLPSIVAIDRSHEMSERMKACKAAMIEKNRAAMYRFTQGPRHDVGEASRLHVTSVGIFPGWLIGATWKDVTSVKCADGGMNVAYADQSIGGFNMTPAA